MLEGVVRGCEKMMISGDAGEFCFLLAGIGRGSGDAWDFCFLFFIPFLLRYQTFFQLGLYNLLAGIFACLQNSMGWTLVGLHILIAGIGGISLAR